MISIIQTTLPTETLAKEIAEKMLKGKLVACTHIEAIQSQYIWKGKYLEEKEYKLSAKTSIQKKNEVIRYMNDAHPYDVPYISSHELSVNNAFEEWVDESLM